MEYTMRLIDELLELQTRIVKLSIFINSYVDPEEILYDQLKIMDQYRRILIKRIHKETGLTEKETAEKIQTDTLFGLISSGFYEFYKIHISPTCIKLLKLYHQ